MGEGDSILVSNICCWLAGSFSTNLENVYWHTTIWWQTIYWVNYNYRKENKQEESKGFWNWPNHEFCVNWKTTVSSVHKWYLKLLQLISNHVPEAPVSQNKFVILVSTLSWVFLQKKLPNQHQLAPREQV